MRTGRTVLLVAASALVVGLAQPVPALHQPTHPQVDQGLSDPGEEQVFARALELLLQEGQRDNLDTVFTLRQQPTPRGGCNLTGSVYWAYARRGTICFTRQVAGEGWTFDVQTVSGVNPLIAQSSTALSTLKEERAASSGSEGQPPDNFRNLVDDSAVTYPFAYERIAAEFDSPRAGDFFVMPNHLADTGGKGAHGHLGQTQSRSTFLISGRGARRSPLSPESEAALGVQHVDIAPTVAKALGVNPYSVDRPGEVARTLNGEPSTTALLERQDGEVLDELLEPVFNTIVVVVDGLRPEDVSSGLMPKLSALINESPSGPGGTHATVYQQARGVMTAETGPNHTAMMTGAYAEGHGIAGDNYIDRQTGEEQSFEGRPEVIMAETLFDRIETQAPWLRTAAVVGKTTLRDSFDCTKAPDGSCGSSSDNPEGVAVTHERPDILAGASTSPSDPNLDCPAEPGTGTGYAHDQCVMDVALRVLRSDDPDMTLINLPNVDGFSHLQGAGGPTQLQGVAVADAQIGRLVDYLKASGKWQHSSVIVTADHNFGAITATLPQNRIFLNAVFAGAGPAPFELVSTGGYASVYLTGNVNVNALSAEQHQTLAALRQRALATPGVAEALYRLPNPADPGANTLDAVHPAWNANTPRIGELVLTADEDHTLYTSQQDSQNLLLGEHGRPTDRHVPFIVMSGGTYVRDQSVAPSGPANQTDDTGALPEQAEAVDIAPTLAWILGVGAPAQSQGRILNGPTDAFAKRPAQAQADGDITEPIANRAAIFIYDQNNSVMVNCLFRRETCEGEKLPAGVHDEGFVPNLRALARNGTLMRYGSIASYPSVTFPNHNVVGSGAHPGHHGIPNNRFYIRETKTLETPIDPQSLQHPLYHFSAGLLSQDVETLHEAVHRTYGNWEAGDGPTSSEAFTASVNEPSVRGADYATLEPTDTEDGTAQDGDVHPSYPNPETYGPTTNPADLLQDTTQACAEDDQGYFVESNLDNLGQTQARRLFDSNTQNGHPLPKYLINNFTLSDGAGHENGPHTRCTFAAYRDNDRRLGRILGAMRGAGVLGETLIVVTGDHGGENQAAGRKGLPSDFAGFLNGQAPPIHHVMADWQVYLRTLDLEASTTQFQPGIPTSVTFTVTDDDVNADGSARPVQGATVTVEDGVTSEVTGTTDSAGRVTLSFTPDSDTIFVRAAAAEFNERLRGFGPLGPIDEGTAAAPGFGGGIGGLCAGLESVLGLHIVGSARADRLTGTSGRNVMCGNGGDDVVKGLDGPDFITGGEGDDRAGPGPGDDNAFGDAGRDTLDYSDVRSAVRVDLKTSTATGAGTDTIGGFMGAQGTRRNDRLLGDGAANRLRGGKGRDRLLGLGGRDVLAGGAGKDRLRGGKGKDLMRGGGGRDACRGGPGRDRAALCERG